MVVTKKMQGSMDGQQKDLMFKRYPPGGRLPVGTRKCDDNIAEVQQVRFRIHDVSRKGKYVGGAGNAAKARIQASHRLLAGQNDRERAIFPVAFRLQRGAHGAPDRRGGYGMA